MPASPTTTLDDATCTACGCACDDIGLELDGGRIVGARRACEVGLGWFLRDHAHAGPDATVDGREASVDEALDRAATLLYRARAPVVLGLSGSTVEAVSMALAVADRLGAAIDPLHGGGASARLRAVARVGRVGATLGEVRDRADVLVFWGVDPVATHPRHFERYSADARGHFVDRRAVLVAGAASSMTSARADMFLQIADDVQFDVLWVLRALANGTSLDIPRAEASTGLPIDALRAWADRLKSARYGAFFAGPGLGDAATYEAALLLVRDLNTSSRFVFLTLGGPGNPAGAEAALAWGSGYPSAVDLGSGAPRPLGMSAAEGLARGRFDAALVVGDGPPTTIPTVAIGPAAVARGGSVALAAATPGIHAGGTIFRADGVALPLRRALPTPLPTDRDLLARLDERLKLLPRRT